MHRKTQTQLLKLFETNLSGLKSAEIRARQKEYGRNEIKAKRRTPLIIQFIEEFKDLMVIILVIAAILAGFAGEKVDASVILFIVILNALIGFLQKYKAEKALEALKKMIQPHAKVIRDGTEKIIDARDLVPGDILILEEGDQVSADSRLTEITDLEANESTLTGESNPVKKTVDPIEKNKINLDENENMVFMGTLVVSGEAKAVVVQTANNTAIGQIAESLREVIQPKMHFSKKVSQLGNQMAIFAIVGAGLTFLVGYFIFFF